MTKSRLWALVAALALVIGTIGLAACGSSDDSTTGGSTTAGGTTGGTADLGTQQDGVLLVGSDIPYPPFEFGNSPDYKGFDVDVVNEIGKRLGLKVTFKDTSFDTIFTDLANDSFDMVASAATITPERSKVVDFSDPYYSADQALITPADSDITSVEDLDGKNVAAQNGTTGLSYAQDETNAANVQGFPQGPDVINAVTSGQVDAGILDQPVAADAEKKAGGFQIAAVIPTGELYGFAFQKSNSALREAVNEQLAAMKKDGSLDSIYNRWFGFKAPSAVINSKPTKVEG